jgi:hypothetical protein
MGAPSSHLELAGWLARGLGRAGPGRQGVGVFRLGRSGYNLGSPASACRPLRQSTSSSVVPNNPPFAFAFSQHTGATPRRSARNMADEIKATGSGPAAAAAPATAPATAAPPRREPEADDASEPLAAEDDSASLRDDDSAYSAVSEGLGSGSGID